MQSTPWDSTLGRTTSGVACYHLLWAAQTVRQRRAWHAITSLGQHTWSDDIGRGMPSSSLGSTNGQTTPMWHANITFGQHTRSNDVRRGCQHRLWEAHTVERRRAWHDITSFGQRTRSNNVGRDKPSPPLESTHDRTTSGVACDHHLWAAQTVRLANKVEQRWAWHTLSPLD